MNMENASFIQQRTVTRELFLGVMVAGIVLLILYIGTVIYRMGRLEGEENAAKKRPFTVHHFPKHPSREGSGEASKSGRSYSPKLRTASETEAKNPA